MTFHVFYDPCEAPSPRKDTLQSRVNTVGGGGKVAPRVPTPYPFMYHFEKVPLSHTFNWNKALLSLAWFSDVRGRSGPLRYPSLQRMTWVTKRPRTSSDVWESGYPFVYLLFKNVVFHILSYLACIMNKSPKRSSSVSFSWLRTSI